MDKNTSVIFGFALHVIVVSLVIVSLVTINISLSAKIIISFFVALLIYIIFSIGDLYKKQTEILYYLRNVYISVETKRLDPENVKPSKDIFLDDIQEKNNYKDAHKSLIGLWEPTINIIVTAVYMLAIVICFALLLKYWGQIEAFLSSLIMIVYNPIYG